MFLIEIKTTLNTLAVNPFRSPCHGTGAMATEHMYSGSLQDVTRSIVRVEGVRR